MHATTIVGYTADADVWCRECAALTYDRRVDGILRTIISTELGQRAFEAVDFEGNPVHPVFACDEGAEDEHCNRCGEALL